MFRSYFYTKALQLWNWVSDQCEYLRTQFHEIKQYSRSYGLNKSWVFMRGHTLPLPLSHIKNDISATWKYSNHVLTSLSQPTDIVCKLSWLSAKIVVINTHEEQEFDIDPFLAAFRVHTHGDMTPSLTFLFLTWCAQTNQWFQHDSIVQFHIIDHQGQEHLLTIGADNRCLIIHDKKIYHQLLKRADSTSELPNAYTYYHPC